MSDLHGKPKVTFYCPAVNHIVEPVRQVKVMVGSELIMWWHCPACHGWHIQKTEDAESEE